jgi:opacity protein-like surface antigen
MTKFLAAAGAAALLAAATLAPSAASAHGAHNGGHHGHKFNHHGPKYNHYRHGHRYGWQRAYGWAGPRCPRVPVTVYTAYGPAVQFVRSCRVYY